MKSVDIEPKTLGPKELKDLKTRLASGEMQPDRGAADDGETFFYQNEQEPLISLGRVPGAGWLYVLKRQDGSLLLMGGAHLHGRGHLWGRGSALSE